MRPVRIELSAFGAYPGIETVDFTQLASRGLYVITGPTGSGKTTVFDAMTFALYNTMPLKDPGEIRSHHAAADVATWVRFSFELDGVEYCVERSPDYERPKKHGTGTTSEKPAASLVRREADGSTTSLATKVNDVTARCSELIGLSAGQFQRVMLLPQGLVSQFLLDDSKRREELLAQLFGGDVYDRAVTELKSVSTERRGALGSSEEALRHHLATARAGLARLLGVLGADPSDDLDEAPADAIADQLSSTDDACALLGTTAAEAAEAAQRAHADATAAVAAARRYDRVGSLHRTLDALGQVEPTVLADEIAATSSQAARPVAVAAGAAELADADAERSRRELGERCASIAHLADDVAIEVELRSAGAIITSLAAADDEVRASRALLDERDRCDREVERLSGEMASRQSQLGEQRSRLSDATAELAQHRSELESLSLQRVDLDALGEDGRRLARARTDRRLLAAERGHQAAAETQLEMLRRTQSQTWRRFVATQAPRLAGDLREGEPCPVCGSPEHPSLAIGHDGAAVSYDDVTAAAAAVDAAAAQLRRVEQAVNDLLIRLGDLVELSEAELIDRVELNRVRVTEAQQLHGRCEELAARIPQLDAEVTDANRSVAALEAMIAACDASLADAHAALSVARERCADLDRHRVDAVADVLHRCRGLATDIESMFESADRAQTTAGNAHERAIEVLAASRFATLADARAALLDEPVERDRFAAAITHRAAVSEARTSLQTLLDEGVPDVRPAADELTAAAAHTRELAERTAAAWKEASIGRSDCTAALERHCEAATATESLRQAALVAERAYQVCAGQGTIKMSLRRWVLANELDRVTAAASVHLQRMTGGRYTIRRQLTARDGRSAFGLDLEVLDAHTGRPRRPNSLSGGEQFQASLALALGLADVISLGGTASGRRTEALFIDEGFGSLDPDALDDAIETLHQLRASGRTVGAITHVEAMKERLHVGIAVERLGSGRGSHLVVTP